MSTPRPHDPWNVRDVPTAELVDRYLAGRTDGLRAA
jgi:hypothetical protein